MPSSAETLSQSTLLCQYKQNNMLVTTQACIHVYPIQEVLLIVFYLGKTTLRHLPVSHSPKRKQFHLGIPLLSFHRKINEYINHKEIFAISHIWADLGQLSSYIKL